MDSQLKCIKLMHHIFFLRFYLIIGYLSFFGTRKVFVAKRTKIAVSIFSMFLQTFVTACIPAVVSDIIKKRLMDGGSNMLRFSFRYKFTNLFCQIPSNIIDEFKIKKINTNRLLNRLRILFNP